ncbi:hypothetical protein YC2023_069472 [Brassica napus]
MKRPPDPRLKRSRPPPATHSPPPPPTAHCLEISPPSSKRTYKPIKQATGGPNLKKPTTSTSSHRPNRTRTTTPLRRKTLHRRGSEKENRGELGVHAPDPTPQIWFMKLEPRPKPQTTAKPPPP